ncbi:DNA circularization N-terminal domain-containing protein [Escherichia coli]
MAYRSWFISEQRERGGRNIVRREYPLRESGGADDLGPKLPEFTFTCSGDRRRSSDTAKPPA